MFAVAGSARLRMRAEQYQNGVLARLCCARRRARRRARESRRDRARIRVAAGERGLRGGEQRRRALLVRRIDVRARFEKGFGESWQSKRSGQDQRGAAAGHARVGRNAMAQQRAHDRFAPRAHRGGKAMNSRMRGMRGIRARFEQTDDQSGVTRTRRTDQRRCTLRIFGIERKSEREHAFDRFDIAERSGRRPDRRRAAARYGSFQRDQLSQYAGSCSLRASAMPSGVSPLAAAISGLAPDWINEAQQRHRGFDVELDGEMQRRAALRIACVRIGAARQQARARSATSPSATASVQRRAVGERRAAPVAAAIENSPPAHAAACRSRRAERSRAGARRCRRRRSARRVRQALPALQRCRATCRPAHRRAGAHRRACASPPRP